MSKKVEIHRLGYADALLSLDVNDDETVKVHTDTVYHETEEEAKAAGKDERSSHEVIHVDIGPRKQGSRGVVETENEFGTGVVRVHEGQDVPSPVQPQSSVFESTPPDGEGPNTGETASGSEATTEDYESHSVEELKGLARDRGLPVSGTHAELVERLEADDAGYEGQTIEQLQDELRSRDLAVSGTKKELVDRLEADDENTE